jgi:hypothetical protein
LLVAAIHFMLTQLQFGLSPLFAFFLAKKIRFSLGAKCDEKWRLFKRPALSLTDLAFFAETS